MTPHEVMHDTGNCIRCGQELTDELSIERGYGPVCHKKHLQAQAEMEANENAANDSETVSQHETTETKQVSQ